VRLLFAARAIDGMAGGVERMVIALSNEMANRGHEVGLFTWDRASAQAFYAMSPAIKWHRLNVGDVSVTASALTRIRRALAARRAVRGFNPDVVIAFQVGVFKALRLYCAGMRVRMIATERNAPTLYDHTSGGEKAKQNAFRTFRMAQYLVVQCEAYRPMHPPYLQDKLLAIPNPVYEASGWAAPEQPDASGRFQLLAVGRLSYQKNFESLIGAFARLASSFPQWDLVILGEGELRAKLEGLVTQRGLSSRVRMPGAVKDTSAQYAKAHLFCLPSLWEGFPNALAEALAHGLPAVGFAESAGVNVLIEHGVTGMLAEGNGGEAELAETLGPLLADGQQRRVFGAQARESMRQYAPERIMDQWESLFYKVVA
jgi:GalNAc-alpha-(1->4)-GalNAc-alpha-(1->3)-diNAcBac-PP-undecaprenol alpha-1,4-N-acetyl-D-galactosaminyltransferase